LGAEAEIADVSLCSNPWRFFPSDLASSRRGVTEWTGVEKKKKKKINPKKLAKYPDTRVLWYM